MNWDNHVHKMREWYYSIQPSRNSTKKIGVAHGRKFIKAKTYNNDDDIERKKSLWREAI